MTSRMCGVRGALVGAEAGPVAEVGREQLAEVVERGRDQPHRADRVGLAGALRVGEPLHPVPVGEVLLGAEHGDHELVGVLEGGRRADHRPRGRADLLVVAAQLDAVEGAQVDRGRQVAAGAGARPAAGAAPRRRPGRPGRRARSPAAPARGRAAASTGRSARAGSCRRTPVCSHSRVRSSAREGRADGLGVVPVERPALLVGGVAGHLADVAEVAEVLGARAGDLLGALLPLPVDLHDDEAERGEEEHAGGQEAAALVARRPSWRPARSTRGCRASGWRSSARRRHPRRPGAREAAAARSARPASPARRAAVRPAVSCSRVPPCLTR